MWDAIRDKALHNAFNPLVDWLYSLKWDGAPRLDQLLIKYMGADNTPLHRAFGRKLICAMVMRAQYPGIKYDYVLVLIGLQGIGKSLFCHDLAWHPDYYTDSSVISRQPRAQAEAVEGKWVVELAELQGLKEAKLEQLKAFIVRTHERERAVYTTRRPECLSLWAQRTQLRSCVTPQVIGVGGP
jgi:predicted P-loop ATPase